MNFINKLERTIGRWAVPNLIVYLIGGYAIGYVLEYAAPSFLSYMTLEPYYIIHNLEIWRLITWVMIPPSQNIIFALIMMFLYYQLGQALERTWGTFRFNLYIWGGIIFTILGVFMLYGFYALQGTYLIGFGNAVSTNYINMGIFLAFATCFPEMQVMLYFIIPVKMKYMAILYGAIMIIEILQGNAALRVVIIMSMLNYLIFFLLTRNYRRINPREINRKRKFKRAYNGAQNSGSKITQFPGSENAAKRPAKISKHTCAICGRTELDSPNMEFRFCSKCDGNYEYCEEHLYTHQHIKRS